MMWCTITYCNGVLLRVETYLWCWIRIQTIRLLLASRVDFANADGVILSQICDRIHCDETQLAPRFEIDDLRQDLWLVASKGTDAHLIARMEAVLSGKSQQQRW